MRSVEVPFALGHRLARDVRDGHGRTLLTAGTALTAGLCAALLGRGFRRVHIRDGVADDVVGEEAITGRTREVATEVARQCFEGISSGAELPMRDIFGAVDTILEDLARVGAVTELDALRSASEYTYVHSVNVCVYALLIGQAVRLPPGELRTLGVGALLHDVGKVFCADLCEKPGPLSPAEMTRVRMHARDGFEILRQRQELHLYAAHIAFQHHERSDGSGYPRGLIGERILPLARMVAVADVYDAMTADRPHARARSPELAVRELQAGAATAYDARFVNAFVSRLAVYPTGTPVLLADGTVAVVTAQGTSPAAPLVRPLGHRGQVYHDAADVFAEGGMAVASILPEWPSWLRGEQAPDPAPETSS